ncbi:GNAT family N-acetyltransferase [Paenarthrobacter sp. DKR-5]|uniref:GNAT family N-acetyltransferase n=1 Tax=Paenarthrobacter sp. DKR-5 TaxID=2835535 RepID=UPI001BDC75E4|nr:GNAT family N-acetyltransferase [Paenarthrobacter sp. DKR-5]MBT1002567.1 GNAT family N-acetyltransferase [Paenarthrobacter sp. DKR-5]
MTSSPHVLIRPASAADFDDVARLTRDAYLAAGYFESAEHPYMQHLQDVASRAAVADVWVAEADGAVAGSVTVVTAGNPYADIARGDEVEFRMLAVDPAVQRGGIGRALVDAVVDHARSTEGICAVSLTSGTDMVRAHRLYETLGFDRVPERDWLVPGTDIRLLVFRLAL